MYDTAAKIIVESWQVLGQMSPYLLFGFLMAGVLSVCISPEWVERHLGGGGLGPVLKASLFGVPLPLCSCSVIPVSASMRRHGASPAATTAFLLSTPQTGVDSIAVTYALLGPVFAVFRPVAAFLTGLVGGGLVQFLGGSGEADVAGSTEPSGCAESCCADKEEQNPIRRILHYGFVTLPRDIGLALVVGILLAGVMAALLPPGQLKAYIGGGVVSILILMAAGVPVYVCATASVPIAAGFMHVGASPGAALAFLIAGPATNAATFATIWKVLGQRIAILYIVTVAISAVACGLMLDWLVPAVESVLPQVGSHVHEIAEGGWFNHSMAIVLVLVLLVSYRLTGQRGGAADDAGEIEQGGDGSGDRGRWELVVEGMTCDHCAQRVRSALTECTGVQSAEVSLKRGRAVVMGDDVDQERVIAALEGLGFSARPV